MKQLIIILFLIVCWTTSYTQDPNISGLNYRMRFPAVPDKEIKNGWYKATVDYYNYSTSTQSEYTLNVKVEYGAVIIIDFGEGKSVHSGYNEHNYIYSGGDLSYSYNKTKDIIKAETTVTIHKGSSIYKYDILIE